MGVEEKVLNCFSCDGKEGKDCYSAYSKTPYVCLYKSVAESDLKKESENNPYTTLTTMLNEYRVREPKK